METKIKNEYPFDYQELGPEETEEAKNYFTPLFSKLVRLGSKGYFFYDAFVDAVLDIYNMEVRPSDTFVVTIPRSGTTWTQELVWLLQNDCDFERAKATPLTIRFPFIESGALIKMFALQGPSTLADSDKVALALVEDVKSLSTMPSPRFFKTHLPLSLLPPTLLDTTKVVYVARDPRDVAVSFFFHMKSFSFLPKDKDFKTYWNFFIQNKTLWCPYFEHVKEAWSQRNHTNLTFVFYEELQEDLPGVARRLATFLNKEYSDEQIGALCDHLKFDNFKNNAAVNMNDLKDSGVIIDNFIRKGKAGGWREHFDPEMTQQAETWIADNLRDTDLRFPQCQ